MAEYFARQFDGGPTACDGRNCACASCAMAVMFNRGAPGISADDVRKRSGVSCTPGAHSPSGGLFISDVERVARSYGVSIDYGRDLNGGQPKRWSEATMLERLSSSYVAIVLGDYDQMGADSAQPNFRGDHSSVAHAYRKSDDTVCFHDPLRASPRRIKWSRLMKYWRKPGSPVLGLAGFVKAKVVAPAPPPTDTEEEPVDVFSVPGLMSAQWPKGTPIYPGPTGTKATGTLPADGRFVIVGQDKAKTPTRYLVDGADAGAPARMAWLPVSSATAKRDESFNAGVVAATGAAAKARR